MPPLVSASAPTRLALSLQLSIDMATKRRRSDPQLPAGEKRQCGDLLKFFRWMTLSATRIPVPQSLVEYVRDVS